MSNPIETYILEQPEHLRSFLMEIHTIFSQALPKAKQTIAWGMPTYKERKNIIHFACHKNHVGIYPGNEAIVHFKEQLTNYKYSKGAFQISYGSNIPKQLLLDMAKWNQQQSQ